MTRAGRFLPRQHQLTSTDLSETRPDPASAKREAPWVKHQQAREQSSVEAMALLTQMSQHMGGLFSLAKAPPVNDVLYSGARLIPANGMDVLEFPVKWSSATIANVSPSLLSVGKSGTGGTPGQGAGIVRIPPGSFRTWMARQEGITVFGQPGSTYDLTIFERPRTPASGQCGIAQGGILIPAGTTASALVNFAGANLGHIAAVLNVSAVSGGETVQVTLNGVTSSGYVYPLLVGLAVGAVGATPYRIGPGLVASPNAVAVDLVPAQIQVIATIAGAGAITYGVDLVAG